MNHTKRLLALFSAVTITSFSFGQGACIYQVEDEYPGGGGSNPALLVEYAGEVYFAAANAAVGAELFKYDGTSVELVADVRPGVFSSSPTNLTVYAGDLYFTANDGTNGTELYKWDGVSATLVDDINPGFFHSFPDQLTVVGSDLMFTADNGTNGKELFKYDGATVTLAADIVPGAGSSGPWNFVALGSELFFTANDGSSGEEPWFWDGATATMIMDVYAGATTSMPSEPVEMGGNIYFRATHPTEGTELWETDGTSCTMIEINPGLANGNPTAMAAIGGTLYFRGFHAVTGYELWQYDGVSASLIEDLDPGAHPNNSWADNIVEYAGDIYFQATDGDTGLELYKYDGVSITLAADINPGAGDGNPQHMFELGGKLYMSAEDGVSGLEPWVFDGTTATMGDDVYPGGIPSVSIPYYTPVGTDIIFAADDGVEGIELFIWPTEADLDGELEVVECGSWTSPGGTLYDVEGIYLFDETIPSVLHPDCDSTISIDLTIVGNDPAFTYPGAVYCENEDNPVPDYIANPGGTFSASPAGMFIYPATGEIDLGFSLPGVYTVKYVTSALCSPTDSMMTTIEIIGVGDPTFNYSASTYCIGQTNPSPIVILDPGGTFSATPAGLSINSSTGEINLGSSSTGSYTIKYVTGGSCQDSSEVTVDIESVDTDVTISGAYLSAVQSGATYQWIKCEPSLFPIVGANGQSYTAPTNGTYCVAVSIGECIDTSDCISVVTYSVDELPLDAYISFYPNPVVNQLTIEQGYSTELQILLTDNSGKLLMNTSTSESQTSIDLSDFARGIYFVTVQNEYGTHTQRVIKN